VFFGNAGVLHRHFPAAKIYQFRAKLLVRRKERSAFKHDPIMPQDEPGNNPPAKKSSSGRPSGRLRRWNAILLSPTEAESANDKCNSSPQGWNAFFQMHSILGRQQLSPNVTRLKVRAPRIAAIRQPGQFVIVRLAENAERIPLTIADADPAAGAITLVIQSVGKSTRELVALKPGDAIRDIVGPLGHATEMIASGRALCIGGGVGTAVLHPIAQSLNRRGVHVTSIIGGRSREWVIFEEELRRLGEVVVCTDDGSHGRSGHCLRGRPGADDARRGQSHPAAGRANHRVAQSGDD
jgi:hypothetical protein